LGAGCWHAGTVIHEVMHALGFWHEQSRPDRDNHIRVDLNNVQPGLCRFIDLVFANATCFLIFFIIWASYEAPCHFLSPAQQSESACDGVKQ